MSIQPEREIYPQVYDWDNLWLAYEKAARGKRGHAPAAQVVIPAKLVPA
ncbi:MAG: hypothetical protein ACFLMY_03885 [Candidatus Brachytrichaceae bacterium NZ_4S206]|jgi:hypothetical protein